MQSSRLCSPAVVGSTEFTLCTASIEWLLTCGHFCFVRYMYKPTGKVGRLFSVVSQEVFKQVKHEMKKKAPDALAAMEVANTFRSHDQAVCFSMVWDLGGHSDLRVYGQLPIDPAVGYLDVYKHPEQRGLRMEMPIRTDHVVSLTLGGEVTSKFFNARVGTQPTSVFQRKFEPVPGRLAAHAWPWYPWTPTLIPPYDDVAGAPMMREDKKAGMFTAAPSAFHSANLELHDADGEGAVPMWRSDDSENVMVHGANGVGVHGVGFNLLMHMPKENLEAFTKKLTEEAQRLRVDGIMPSAPDDMR